VPAVTGRDRRETRNAKPETPSSSTTVALWFGALGGALAWTVHLLLSYALVAPACAAGGVWMLHAVTVGTLAPTILAGLLSHRAWQRHRADPQTGVRGEKSGWRRFMALAGLVLSVLFGLAIVLEGLPAAILSPCW
jgi:hypothetical protein